MCSRHVCCSAVVDCAIVCDNAITGPERLNINTKMHLRKAKWRVMPCTCPLSMTLLCSQLPFVVLQKSSLSFSVLHLQSDSIYCSIKALSQEEPFFFREAVANRCQHHITCQLWHVITILAVVSWLLFHDRKLDWATWATTALKLCCAITGKWFHQSETEERRNKYK